MTASEACRVKGRTCPELAEARLTRYTADHSGLSAEARKAETQAEGEQITNHS